MSCSHSVDRRFELRDGRERGTRHFRDHFANGVHPQEIQPPTQRSPQHPDRCPSPPSSRFREETRGKSLPLSLPLAEFYARRSRHDVPPVRGYARVRACIGVCADDHNAVDRLVGRSIVLASDVHGTGITQHHHRSAPDRSGMNNSEARESLRSLSAPLFGGVYRSARGTRDSSLVTARETRRSARVLPYTLDHSVYPRLSFSLFSLLIQPVARRYRNALILLAERRARRRAIPSTRDLAASSLRWFPPPRGCRFVRGFPERWWRRALPLRTRVDHTERLQAALSRLLDPTA